MILLDQFGRATRLLRREAVRDPGASDFWGERFFPRWLPIMLGLGLGSLAAVLIARGSWQLAAVLTLLVPLGLALIRYPFGVVLVWILILPIFNGLGSIGALAWWLLHRSLIPIAIVLVILNDWLGLRQRPSVRLGVAEWVLMVFSVVGLGSSALAPEVSSRLLMQFYDLLIVPIGLYVLVRLAAPNERDYRNLLWVALFVVAVQSTIGFLSWIAPGLLPSGWKNLVGARATGTFNGPAVYTATLVFMACLLMHWASISRSRLRQLALICAVGLAFVAVFVSFSRGSWVGGLAVGLVLIFVYPRLLLAPLAVSLAVVLILANSLFAAPLSFAWERLNTENTAASRIVGNVASLQMIRERPAFGWGFGNYNLYDDRFKTRVLDIEVDEGSTSHNTYLSIMAELGLVGFGLYMFTPVWWLALSARVWKRLPRDGLMGRSLLIVLWLAMLDNFLVSNFMDMVRHEPLGTGLWWIALGLIANYVYPRLPAEVSARSPVYGATR